MNRFPGTDEADNDEMETNERIPAEPPQKKNEKETNERIPAEPPQKKKREHKMTEARIKALERMKEGAKKRQETIKKIKQENPELLKEMKLGRPRKEIKKKNPPEVPYYKQVEEKLKEPPAEVLMETPIISPAESLTKPADVEKKKKKKIVIVQDSGSDTDDDDEIEIVNRRRRGGSKRNEEIFSLRQELESLKKELPRQQPIDENILNMMNRLIRR